MVIFQVSNSYWKPCCPCCPVAPCTQLHAQLHRDQSGKECLHQLVESRTDWYDKDQHKIHSQSFFIEAVVPHPWLKQMLKAIRAPKNVRKAVENLILYWRTNLEVLTEDGVRSIPINLKRGLFQGDSLSPLLFCLCVAPLSHELKKNARFRSEFQAEPVTHLMFIDVYGKDQHNYRP